MSLVSAVLAHLATAALALAAPQQSFPDVAAIQRMVDERAVHNQEGGIVLAIYRPGEPPRIYAAGSSGREGLPLDGDTLFEIGSITKTFTTALLADMVRRGEVRLDDPVADHLPALRVPQKGRRRPSLLDLATHTSGLPALPSN